MRAKRKPARGGRASPCPSCGYTSRRIRRYGFVGCPDCYRHFARMLRRRLLSLHGRAGHRGKRPRGGLPAPSRT